MAQGDWKFHDYDMLLDHPVKIGRKWHRYAVVYRLTNLPDGSMCLVYWDAESMWIRKTKNAGRSGSIRYQGAANLDAALLAGVKWARRKDEEAAARLKSYPQHQTRGIEP